MNIDAIQQIEHDFAERAPPFDSIEFPEERLLDELPHSSMEGRLQILSMFSMFDYNRNASQLVDNLISLYEEAGQPLFNPATATRDVDRIAEIFSDIGFRYPNRDAAALQKNQEILRRVYSGCWSELLLSVSCNAVSLVERLNEDGFSCLKGDKIAPMYARFINDYVAPLNDVWDLEIPVDTHIRRLSTELFDASNDDEIRERWRAVAHTEGVERHVVDGALWQIGNNWDEWGEGYWNETVK